MADDGVNDQVTLRLGGDDVFVATAYEVRQSILQQPAEFSLRLGQGSEERNRRGGASLFAGDLMASYPPNTPFELRIDGNLRMSGKTDGYRATGAEATEVTIFGRDALAPMHDSHVPQEGTFKDPTYRSLVQRVMKLVGLDPALLDASNESNRKRMAGVPIRQLLPSKEIDALIASLGTAGSSSIDQSAHKAISRNLTVKLGLRWYDFVRKQLDRAGLFLWAAADGRFVLSSPNVGQDPIYHIVRERGQTRDQVNVEHADLLYDTRPMFCYATVYGRSGGRKFKRGKSIGDSTDDQMLNMNFDKHRTLVIRDTDCQTNVQAAYLASRKLAEARRHGRQLVYTLSGHSMLNGSSSKFATIGSGKPAVWTPDTIVQVDDDEFRIHDKFWIESVEFRRAPATTTTIRLMHIEDVIFGEADAS